MLIFTPALWLTRCRRWFSTTKATPSPVIWAIAEELVDRAHHTDNTNTTCAFNWIQAMLHTHTHTHISFSRCDVRFHAYVVVSSARARFTNATPSTPPLRPSQSHPSGWRMKKIIDFNFIKLNIICTRNVVSYLNDGNMDQACGLPYTSIHNTQNTLALSIRPECFFVEFITITETYSDL